MPTGSFSFPHRTHSEVGARTNHQAVRESDLRDRHRLGLPAQDDFMRGWVRFGLSQALPLDASAEMRAGYNEARNNAIDVLTGQVSS